MPLNQITTVEWLKSVFMYGITTTDDQGEPYGDELWHHSIDSAIAMAEAAFDVNLTSHRRAVFTERKDSQEWTTSTWSLLHVNKRPLSKVRRLVVQWGNREAATLPNSWVLIASKAAGQIQLVPGGDGFSSIGLALQGIPWAGSEGFHQGYIPGWYSVEFESSFEFRLDGQASVDVDTNEYLVTLEDGPNDDDETVSPRAASQLRTGHWIVFDDDETATAYRVQRIKSDTEFVLSGAVPSNVTDSTVTVLAYDPLLIDFVGLTAALLPLDTAGDLIIGAGISSLSLSMDALSQSISTTSGVENSGYGARALQYVKRLDSTIKRLTRRYRAINMMVV